MENKKKNKELLEPVISSRVHKEGNGDSIVADIVVDHDQEKEKKTYVANSVEYTCNEREHI